MVDEQLIMSKSPSLGIAGWSDPDLVVRDYADIERERLQRERQVWWSFDLPAAAENVEDHNVKVLQLISILGEKDAGRNAILQALAQKQGFSQEDVEEIQSGASQKKLQVPAYMRGVLSDIGLAGALAPLNVMEVIGG